MGVALPSGSFNFKLLYDDLPHLRRYPEPVVRDVVSLKSQRVKFEDIVDIVNEPLDPEQRIDIEDVKAIYFNRWVKDYCRLSRLGRKKCILDQLWEQGAKSIEFLQKQRDDATVDEELRQKACGIILNTMTKLSRTSIELEEKIEIVDEINILKASTHADSISNGATEGSPTDIPEPPEG